MEGVNEEIAYGKWMEEENFIFFAACYGKA